MARKVAIVTGAGTGIGKAAALGLARDGYAVVFTGRRREPIEVAAGEAKQLGAEALAIPADVSNPKSVAALFAETHKAFGRLDVLFNNAGVRSPAVPFEDLSFEQWSAVVDANLTGAFLCSQQAFRLFKSQEPRGGRIINNGSISAHAPRPSSAPYTATKHGISGLTRACSLDGRAFDICVGQIDIGNASTELTARMKQGVPQADGNIAVEPLIDVEDVARAVVYMAGLPLTTNVLFMTVMANQMPFVGRG